MFIYFLHLREFSKEKILPDYTTDVPTFPFSFSPISEKHGNLKISINPWMCMNPVSATPSIHPRINVICHDKIGTVALFSYLGNFISGK